MTQEVSDTSVGVGYIRSVVSGIDNDADGCFMAIVLEVALGVWMNR